MASLMFYKKLVCGKYQSNQIGNLNNGVMKY